MNKVLSLSFAVVVVWSPAVVAVEQATVEELEQRCEELREAHLAPLREAEIEKCKAEKAMEPAKCESYYKDYGDATRGAGGKYTERMFNNLPPCVQAREMKTKTRESTRPSTKRGDTKTDLDDAIKALNTSPQKTESTVDNRQRQPREPTRESTRETNKRDTVKVEPSSNRDSSLRDSKRDSTRGKSER